MRKGVVLVDRVRVAEAKMNLGILMTEHRGKSDCPGDWSDKETAIVMRGWGCSATVGDGFACINQICDLPRQKIGQGGGGRWGLWVRCLDGWV